MKIENMEQVDTGNVVALRDVSKDYLKGKIRVPVLRGLDLDIREGEFIALMGSSGSGKTTLLNLIGGLDRPSAGSVMFRGTAINRLNRTDLSDWRARHVGFVFQFYNLLPPLTAAQNIELPLLLTSLPKSERAKRVEASLKIVGLLERRKHYPSELSGGQQQRVAIARALISDPDLLLCDEPTGDLDRKTGAAIMEILRLLNTNHRKTIILATHDPNVAAYAHRTIRFDKSDFSSESADDDI